MFETEIFGEQLGADYLEWLVEQQWPQVNSHFGRLWEYYANDIVDFSGSGAVERKVNESGRGYVQAQEYGLPSRITGLQYSGGTLTGARAANVSRKEVVIENDIGWRVNATVDFLFGKPIEFVSQSPEAGRREKIECVIKTLFAANGGIGFFQDMAVLGGVYGFVDCLVRTGEHINEHFINHSEGDISFDQVLRLAGTIGLELVEAPRALPVLDENDYKRIRFYIQHFYQKKNRLGDKGSFLSQILSRGCDKRKTASVTEILSSDAWQRYEDGELVAEGGLPWGFLPVVHIQNIAQPYYYEGLSDVEPLMPLQDELNTRLSDRANRITFQSFKMYLGKCIEGFEDRPVAPGRMWFTDNPEASIEEFGGDSASPSENSHIAEIREAMDKVSGVTPLVAGILKNKLGHLTSAVALKLTLMGMLSKTERKRFTYGEGIKRICRMSLEILDKSDIFPTTEQERDIEIRFAEPLPENTIEKLEEARMKKDLGVDTGKILKELGY
ncbi:MAG: phage portal protein [Phycisphaerae bacterium]|nr:phage portal protein [Phycisphaerae bacterium]